MMPNLLDGMPTFSVELRSARSGWNRTATLCSHYSALYGALDSFQAYRPVNPAAAVRDVLLGMRERLTDSGLWKAVRERVDTLNMEHKSPDPDTIPSVYGTFLSIDHQSRKGRIDWIGACPALGWDGGKLHELIQLHTAANENLVPDDPIMGEIITRGIVAGSRGRFHPESKQINLDKFDLILMGSNEFRKIKLKDISEALTSGQSVQESVLKVASAYFRQFEGTKDQSNKEVSILVIGTGRSDLNQWR